MHPRHRRNRTIVQSHPISPLHRIVRVIRLVGTPVGLKLLRILVDGTEIDAPTTSRRLGEVVPEEGEERKTAADYAASYFSVPVRSQLDALIHVGSSDYPKRPVCMCVYE